MQQGTRLTTTVYDSQGYPYSVTNAENETTVFDHDSVGRVLEETRPDLKVTTFEYDAEGRTVGITPPESEVHGMTYGSYDLLSSYEAPELDAWTPSATTYTYNLDKQVTEIQPPGAYLLHQYDTAGRLLQLTHGNGEITRSYHASTGRLETLSTSGTDAVDLTFYHDGPLMTEVGFSGAVEGTVIWSHDTSFRVIEENVRDMNGAWGQANFNYDDDSLLTEAQDLLLVRDPASGEIDHADSGHIVETFGYNDYGEIDSKVATLAGSPPVPLVETNYIRDDLGRITQKTESVLGGTPVVTAYSYDSVGRLWRVTEGTVEVEYYEYDSNGNRTHTKNSAGVVSATFDVQDRIEQFGDLSFTFSSDGQLQTKDKASPPQQTNYEYDDLGNLLLVELPNGDSIEYVVDGRGRRVAKRRNGNAEKQWLWRSELQPVAELDDNGVIVAQFIYAGGDNAPELMHDGSNTYRLLKDHLGSVRMVVDIATGVIAQEMEYDAFGRVLYDSKPGFQPFGFAGGLYDPDTGLVRFGARDYDPEIGRWTTKDPIRFDGGLNLYEYVGGDPVNFVDSSGLHAVADAVRDGLRAGAPFLPYAFPAVVPLGAACLRLLPFAAAGAAVGVAGWQASELYDEWDTDTMIDGVCEDVGMCIGGGSGDGNDYCKQAKEKCIDQCIDTLPTGLFYGAPYHRCMRECMEAEGCWGR